MNRALLRGGRRRRSPIRAGHPDLPGRCRALADWCGTQASASQIRNGHRCVTFGPRSFARRRRGVSARAAVTWAGSGKESRPEAEKPATAVPGGPGRKEAFDATC